jgi:hypothetical protein
MARIDRVFARATEAPRRIRKCHKLRPQFDKLTRKIEYVALPHHVTANPWGRERFADLVDRRNGMDSSTPRMAK